MAVESEQGQLAEGTIEIHAILATTGALLATARLRGPAVAGELYRAVAAAAAAAGKPERYSYHALVGGRFMDPSTPLAAAGVRPSSTLDFVRCPPSGVLTSAEDGTAKVFNVDTGLCVATLYSRRAAHPGRFSPDGRHVIWCSPSPPSVAVHRLGRPEALMSIPSHGAAAQAAAWSHDGQLVATASRGRRASLWSVRTGECVRTFEGHTDEVLAVAFSPDDTRLATAAADATARIWCTASGSCVSVLRHPWSVSSVSFSPDGCWAATAAEDRVVRVWNLTAGTCLRELRGHDRPIAEALFGDCWAAPAEPQPAA